MISFILAIFYFVDMVHVYILVMALRERVFGRKLCYMYSVLVAQFDIAELVHVPNCEKKKIHVTNALCVL